MLKLVRNVIGDLKNIVDRNNQFIRWSDLVHLHELQQQENMHLANKLRSAHIHYHNQKMKVQFAAQIFSTSVANALLICKNTLKLKEFKSCQGTIEFLHVFNDLFDILNSKNMKQSGFKQPLKGLYLFEIFFFHFFFIGSNYAKTSIDLQSITPKHEKNLEMF